MQYIQESATPLQALFNLVIFAIVTFLAYKAGCCGYRKYKGLIIFLVILFCLFAFWGADYFHYMEWFIINKGGAGEGHIENVYLYILKFSPTYTIFRLIIWGSAFFLLWKTSTRLKLDNKYFLFLFVICYLLRFSYSRTALGVAILFYGISFLIKPDRNKLFSYIWAFGVVVAAFFFHRSMLFAILPVFLSIVKLRRPYIIIALALFPFVVYVVNNLLYEHIMLNELVADDSTQYSAMQAYMNYDASQSSRSVQGPGMRIMNILQLIPFYVALVYFMFCSYFMKGFEIQDSRYHYILRFYFWIVYIASAFAFQYSVIHLRVMLIAYVPLIVLLAEHKETFGRGRATKLVLITAIFFQIYAILYSSYLTIA